MRWNPFYPYVERRFQQIGQMLDGKPPEGSPRGLDLTVSDDAVRALSHFETAALAVARTQMLRIEALIRDLFETIADIKGFGTAAARPQETDAKPTLLLLDPDRIAAAVRSMATLWLAYLLWIYTEIPGGIGFVIIAGSLGMAVSSMPQLSVSALFVPAAVSIGRRDRLEPVGRGAFLTLHVNHLPGRGRGFRPQVLGLSHQPLDPG